MWTSTSSRFPLVVPLVGSGLCYRDCRIALEYVVNRLLISVAGFTKHYSQNCSITPLSVALTCPNHSFCCCLSLPFLDLSYVSQITLLHRAISSTAAALPFVMGPVQSCVVRDQLHISLRSVHLLVPLLDLPDATF